MEPENVLPSHLVDDEVESFTRWTGLQPEGLSDIIGHYQDRESPHHDAAAECLFRIVESIKAHCAARGVTKYCHWFNSWTGSPAYKRDSLHHLSPETLFQGEPDASSKPTGGLRSTYEARGYTVWDSKAPLFILNGTTLCIPTLFISYNGEALDLKSPALRARAALARTVERFLDAATPGRYDWSEVKVSAFAGPEQEYFLLPAEPYRQRPDLVHTNATVISRPPPKNQQLEEHYLGSISSDVHDFFEELNAELAKLGVVPSTDHNEVAPRQFEFAPLFDEAVRAADSNLLVMHTLREVAERHGWVAVTHEKPFAGLNGSGKHLNFSIGIADRKTGEPLENLFEPAEDPDRRLVFVTVLAAAVAGIHRRAALLRASVATRSNDLRLGGNEAPPAVISVYLGESIRRLADELGGKEGSASELNGATLNLALEGVPLVSRHHTDRNRTSPVAFTGDKLEFRMPGADCALFLPLTVLLGATAEVLDEVASRLEEEAAERPTAAILLDAFAALMGEAAPVLFEGDCYSKEWKAESERRGLPRASATAAALEAFVDEGNQAFLERQGIWSRSETNAFYRSKLEEYAKEVSIEARTMLLMVESGICPAAQSHQSDLARRAEALGAASAVAETRSSDRADALASQLGRALDDLASFGERLDRLAARTAALRAEHDSLEEMQGESARGRHAAAKVVPAMAALRESCDEVEAALPAWLYPFPTCEDLLTAGS